MNKEGSHVLVGIVSQRLGESCNQQDYSMFTSVSALKQWIESSIKENGGMASCGLLCNKKPFLRSPMENNEKSEEDFERKTR